MAGRPPIQYAKSGDLSIAYQVMGDGPLDVVLVPGFVSHLDLKDAVPSLRQVGERISSFARIIQFDKRGTGLSDRTAGLPTLAERMDDIRAVMDAAGSERAAVIGISEGGPAAMLFAATYPERTRALVMWLTAIAEPYDAFDEEGQEFVDTICEFIGEHWGDGAALRMIAGTGAPNDPSVDEVLRRFERNSATPAAAQAVWRRMFVADARPFLSAVTAPTLFVAHTGDNLVPLDIVHENAAAMRDCKVIEVPVEGHWSWDVLTAPDMDAIEEFLTGRRRVPPSERVLATILYTDIVGSTERAAALGDRRWRALLDEHDSTTRQELERFRGREIKATGDGFLAAFDGPARAIECAQSIVREANVLGIEVRAGLHAGECEVRGDDLAGITLHVGARVAALAGPSEVLVSRTVRDLVVGSDLEFEDRGEHTLKGVPGSWSVFAAQAIE